MNDKAKDLGLIPSIKPAQDEVASYRRGSRVDAPRQSNFNGVLVFVILVMAIMMAVGGFTLYEVRQKLDQSNVLLAKGQASIQELENRLAATGTDVSKTLQIIQGKLETSDFEIRKLWDVANKRNKNLIEDNEEAIASLRQQTTRVSARVSGAEKGVSALEGRVESLSAGVDGLRQEVLADSEELNTQVSLLRGQVQDQRVAVDGNERTIAILKKDMKDTAEAIEAIDQHRVQINQELRVLRTELQNLVSEPAPE